jgi:hypothetical protein
MRVRLQNPVTDKSEEAGRRHAVIEPWWLAPGPQSGGGPQEVIGFGDDNP